VHVQPGAAAAALPSLTNECYFTSVTESMLPLSLSPQMVARSGFSIESGLDDAIARAGTGPFTSLPLGEAPFEIGGSVAPGYEAVKDAFAANRVSARDTTLYLGTYSCNGANSAPGQFHCGSRTPPYPHASRPPAGAAHRYVWSEFCAGAISQFH
jgi:hypothetical protein